MLVLAIIQIVTKENKVKYIKTAFILISLISITYTIPGSNGNGGPVDKEIIRNILEDTRLLKRHISPEKEPYLAALLEELELILTEIKNVTPGKRDSMESLQEMIREKNMPLKIDLFKNKVKRSERI